MGDDQPTDEARGEGDICTGRSLDHVSSLTSAVEIAVHHFFFAGQIREVTSFLLYNLCSGEERFFCTAPAVQTVRKYTCVDTTCGQGPNTCASTAAIGNTPDCSNMVTIIYVVSSLHRSQRIDHESSSGTQKKYVDDLPVAFKILRSTCINGA